MKILIDLIMFPVVVVIPLVIFTVMMASMIPAVPLVILAAPAAIVNDANPKVRKPWNKLTGWKRVLMAPYLAYHKFVVEKILRKKQMFV